MVKYGKFSNSRADNSDSSGPISSIIEVILAHCGHIHFDQVW